MKRTVILTSSLLILRSLPASPFAPEPAGGEWTPYFETTNTVVTAVRQGVTNEFAAPESAYRFLHYGSTNFTHVTHAVSNFDGCVWTRGEAVSNLTGWTVAKVRPSRRVAVIGRDVFLERGFECDPPSRGTVRTDSDGDGIPHGWEIYVVSDPNDPTDAVSDWDSDGLTLAEEYNHGNYPTNPWKMDTRGQAMSDVYTHKYRLNPGESAIDSDGDGLSNMAEYMINEVFRWQPSEDDLTPGDPRQDLYYHGFKIDPDNPMTDGYCPDYFLRMGDLYLGFVFSDHDQVDDAWEARYPSAANPSIYDCLRDDDLDGWTNYDECRAGTDPTDSLSHPIPKVEMTVRFEETDPFQPPLVVKAWNETRDPGCVHAPDAVWTVTNDVFRSRGKVVLRSPDESNNGSLGWLRCGKTTFLVYAANAGGSYTAGNPLGVVRGADVGFASAAFAVDLARESPICKRVSIRNGDGETPEDARLVVRPAGPGEDVIRVRLVRYMVDDVMMYDSGVQLAGSDEYGQLVAMDKTFDLRHRDFVCELDVIGVGKFDIDWGTLSGTSYLDGAVVNGAGEPLGTVSPVAGPKGSGCSVTNMTYLIVLGDGPKDFLGSADTNTRVRVAGTITRRFDRVCATPACVGVIGGGDVTPAGVVYTAHPTFVWTMPGESAWTKRFGSSYTAFQLRIRDAEGKLVYVSDVTRAPAQDAEGRFVWTAPISVGGQTPQGKVFANNATYTWDVAMFNAKFMPGSSAKWAQSGTFSTSVNAQQPMNDAGFSSIGVTVKYTGPEKTLYDRDAKVWLSDDLAKTTGKVRVQAFTTADFSGVPACETVVADHAALFDTANVFTNAVLKGLAAGTYYVRAYVDSNGNFVKDDFESWGYVKEPVTVGPDVIRQPAVGLYIEDADTNGNWYPDAWEYQYLNKGNLPWEQIAGQKAAAPREDGKIVLAKAVYDQMVNGLAGISTGLSGAKITVFQDAKYAELLLDPEGDWDTVETTFDAIRKAVSSNITERVTHEN